MNVADYLPLRANEMPDTFAVRVPHRNEHATFAQLEILTNQYASYFQSKGLKQGSKVLVLLRPSLSLVSAVFALFKIGAVPVIIDPGMGFKNFFSCIKNTSPSALIAPPLATLIFRNIPLRISPPKNFPSQLFQAPSINPDDLAAIAFTSGSTGAPKGVCYTHSIFNAQVNLIQSTYNIKPGEIDLPLLPIFALFNPALGMTTIVPDMNPSRPASVNPQKLISTIHNFNVTNSFGSPVLWTKILPLINSQNAASLKRIIMAGCSVPPPLIQQYNKILPHTKIHAPYGATEALPLTDISTPISNPGHGSCLGTPLPSINFKILPLPNLDRVGEIAVSGPVVTQSYYNNPSANKLAKFTDNNTTWHKMGDLGYFDDNNQLWFCGRKAEMISINNNTYLTDPIESLINTHPKVYRSALINCNNQLSIVIQPNKWPLRKKPLIQEIKQFCQTLPPLPPISNIFLKKHFPVDVRHNAKIHRLTLTKEFSS